MKNIIKHINGGVMFVVSVIMFFLVPKLYRLFDPTAGQYDAGVLHNIFIGAIYVSFSASFAWLSLKLVAPGVHKVFDEYVEQRSTSSSDQITLGAILYILFFLATILTIILV